MGLRLALWWRGFLRVTLSGRRPERLLNRLMQEDVPVWGVRTAREDGGLELLLRLRDLPALRRAARGLRVRVRIRERGGAPFLARRMRAHRGWVGGAALALLFVYLLSNFVWFVEVRGNHQLPRQAILAVLAREGLKPGAFRPLIDPARVAGALERSLPQVAWAGIRIQGSRALVRVVEKLPEPKPAPARPADVVARREAQVVRVEAEQGLAQVKPGDIVEPGRVLISGQVPVAREGGGEGEGVLWVHARGRVLGRVWYSAYAEAALVYPAEVPTGRSYARWQVEVLGARLEVGWPPWWQAPPFGQYRRRVVEVLPAQWRHLWLPVSVRRVQYNENATVLRRRDVHAAERAARESALALIRRQLVRGARIVEERTQVVQRTAQRVGVWVQLETIEEIGVARAVEPAPVPGGAGQEGRTAPPGG
ncbi:MAG: sporulation protein YqfD [Bacillota bacterium]|nr:sporulation protein YqfD [Bacillota bacterium]